MEKEGLKARQISVANDHYYIFTGGEAQVYSKLEEAAQEIEDDGTLFTWIHNKMQELREKAKLFTIEIQKPGTLLDLEQYAELKKLLYPKL